MNNNGVVAIFFKISKSFGGAERRLIRLFGALFAKDVKSVSILILEDGMTKEMKSQIYSWAKCTERVQFFSRLTDVLLYIKRNRVSWVCAASLGFTTTLLFCITLFMGIKRMFCSVESSASRLIFRNWRIKMRFYSIVLLANNIDCLYPQGQEKIRTIAKTKHVTLTPGAFVDMQVYEIKNKKKIILFASRLVPGKNAELFIEAVSIIQEQIREQGFRCIICGDGPLREVFLKLCKEKGVEDIVNMPGVADMKLYTPHARIFCSLQKVTNYPSQALLEAMACGCYCIVTDTGESNLMVIPKFGMLINGIPEVLADALYKSMMMSEEQVEEVANSARSYVEQNFTLEQSIEHYERIFSIL